MKPTFIGIGLCLIAAGSFLSGIGHYDGVLGADDPDTFLAKDRTHEATTRVTVLGTPQQAEDQFLVYQAQFLMPSALESPMNQGDWVGVSVAGTDAEAYLRLQDEIPQTGTLLVFKGTVEAYWPIYDAGSAIVGSKPILLLEPVDYHEPILFKA